MPRERSAPDGHEVPAHLALPCTLRRAAGSPIASTVLDVGISGMRVRSRRPLGVDEELAFSIEHEGNCIRGSVRVVCQESPTTYALRFERLPEPDVRLVKSLIAALS